MHRTIIGVSVAAALSLAVLVGVRTSHSQDRNQQQNHGNQELALTGCLERSSDGNILLKQGMLLAGSDVPAGTPVGTSGRVDASPAQGTETWNLDAGDMKLDSYVGQKVEVTGREGTPLMLPQSYESGRPVSDLQVSWVKAISPSCD
jgi:hypothetical protein